MVLKEGMISFLFQKYSKHDCEVDKSNFGEISLILTPLSFISVFALSPFLKKPLSIMIYFTLPLFAACNVLGSAIIGNYQSLDESNKLYYCVMFWMALGTRFNITLLLT